MVETVVETVVKAQDISSMLAASALISLGFTVIDLSGYQATMQPPVTPGYDKFAIGSKQDQRTTHDYAMIYI